MKTSFVLYSAMLFLMSSFRASAAPTQPVYKVNIPQPASSVTTSMAICTTGDSSSSGGPALGLFIDDGVSVIAAGTPLPSPGDCKQVPLTIPADQIAGVPIEVKLKVSFSITGYHKIGSVTFGAGELSVCNLQVKYTYSFFSFSAAVEKTCVADAAK